MIDDAVSWLITFSSPYHLAWFLLSMFLLLLALTIRPWRGTLHGYVIIFHGVVAIEATITTILGIESRVFSMHCIWFNLLMAFAHWRLLVRLHGTEGRS